MNAKKATISIKSTINVKSVMKDAKSAIKPMTVLHAKIPLQKVKQNAYSVMQNNLWLETSVMIANFHASNVLVQGNALNVM